MSVPAPEILSAAPQEFPQAVAAWLGDVIRIEAKSKQKTSICLSGGNTPLPVYRALVPYLKDVETLEFFWGDERCVGPEDRQSNFGAAKLQLFDQLDPARHAIHRMEGELAPGDAADRYDRLLQERFPRSQPFSFDLTLLGMGDDGHTASLFPGQVPEEVFTRDCAAVYAGESTGWRLTLTPGILNRSRTIALLATESKKGDILRSILAGTVESQRYPLSWIDPRPGRYVWWLDPSAEAILSPRS